MTEKDFTALQRELNELRTRVMKLEEETVEAEPLNTEWTRRYYPTYYATSGFFLGMLGSVTSLVFNVVGSLLVGQHPLQLIKVYLTFGLGQRALDPRLDGGMALAIGCCLYIATGMLLGIPFQIVLSRFADRAPLLKRLVVATLFGLAVWIINYYLILTWLQPWLFGGNWIVNMIPWWVAALTHLVFGWTMALAYPLGMYEPYRVRMG